MSRQEERYRKPSLIFGTECLLKPVQGWNESVTKSIFLLDSLQQEPLGWECLFRVHDGRLQLSHVSKSSKPCLKARLIWGKHLVKKINKTFCTLSSFTFIFINVSSSSLPNPQSQNHTMGSTNVHCWRWVK